MRINETYHIVRGTGSTAELERYRQCFVSNGSHKTLELLQWNHQQNLPAIQSIYYAIDAETREIAAIYTYLPVKFTCMGRVVNALQSFDTLTDKNHRGKGLFIRLASQIESEEKQKDNELVYGFPNENSVHGFVNKLKFNYFGEVPFLIKPLRIGYFVNKLLKQHKNIAPDTNCEIIADKTQKIKDDAIIKEITRFHSEYDALYELVIPKIKIGVNRDAAYMNWRYVNKPGENYYKYGYYERDVLKGVIIFTLKHKHGGRVGYLMELLFEPGNEKVAKSLLDFCVKAFKKNKADVILAWCFDHSFNHAAIRNRGFYKFPEKLRPQKLGFIAKTLNSRQTADIYTLKNWYLSYSDSDTV